MGYATVNTSPLDLKREFLDSVLDAGSLTVLFEYLPDLYFWVKNERLLFVMANQRCAEKCGFRSEEELIGKTDTDFFPRELSENFQRDDREILETGKKIINRVELVPNEDGTVDWHSTNKIPVYGKNGDIVGVAGTTRNLKKADSILQPYMGMTKVVEYISANYASHIDIKELAKLAALSVSQFERNFKRIFRVSPKQFIIKVRVKNACKALIHSQENISQISFKTGFYDQSYFSRQFYRHMGMLPTAYRKKFAQGGS